jgi:hypothetical protein
MREMSMMTVRVVRPTTPTKGKYEKGWRDKSNWSMSAKAHISELRPKGKPNECAN